MPIFYPLDLHLDPNPRGGWCGSRIRIPVFPITTYADPLHYIFLYLGDDEPVLQGNISATETTTQGPGAPNINTLGTQKSRKYKLRPVAGWRILIGSEPHKFSSPNPKKILDPKLEKIL